MSRWTPRYSVYLSKLLDDVVGTQEMVEIRKDFCKLTDCNMYVSRGCSHYFTGSKAEGLDLTGSDKDTMRDLNEDHHIEVTDQEYALPRSGREQLFVMVTDNVHPAFAMLRCIKAVMPCIVEALQVVDSSYFLSSYLTVFNHFGKCQHTNLRMQGPSIEHSKGLNGHGTEEDVVFSIHCPFWPSTASEFACRTRPNGWPSKLAINKIVEFGFHLVPIGHPPSSKCMLEWRLSFSIAEKFLVWSFNHIQIQMYAVLKLILKEFIKANCSDENFVLCSYFIKTFLFWKFEETEISFWKAENFKDCLKYLLVEFHKLLQNGELKHYFIPRFNLLEVKFTRNAQLELLQLYDIVVQSDIKIIGQCKSLKQVWKQFSERYSHESSCLGCSKNKSITHFLNTTNLMVGKVFKFLDEMSIVKSGMDRVLDVSDSISNTMGTSLLSLTVRSGRLMNIVPKSTNWRYRSNKNIYGLSRLYNALGTDIATGKLWSGLLFLSIEAHRMVLITIKKLLSSIPPYALTFGHRYGDDYDAQILYANMFLNSELNLCQIAKKAWLFNFRVFEGTMCIMPAAIQIELIYAEPSTEVNISPYTCAYYLQFLSYHGLRQYENRNNALRELVDVAETPKQCNCACTRSRAYNIAGHCLLFVGETVRAKEMFLKSCEINMKCKEVRTGNKYNSALHYLQSSF